MNEYVLIFRRDYSSKDLQPSYEQLQNSIKKWQHWFESIVTQDKLAMPLQCWDPKGKVINQHREVIDGPYTEIVEAIGGLIIIKAANYHDALEIAMKCPILDFGGNIEIRQEALASYR